jgi:hypothetical protein
MTATLSRPKAQPKARTYKPTGDIGRHLQEAYRLQSKIDALEEQLQVHRDYILMHMEEKELDIIRLDGITVYRRKRHNWKYSVETQNEMLKLQTTQKYEQAKGIATDNPRVYISLTHKEAQK